MQPPKHTLSDYYTHQIHHQPSQYYSYFPTQNPNPNRYPLHQQHQLQIKPPQLINSVTDPDPPGAETYFRPSYPINYSGNDYNAHLTSSDYDAQYVGNAYGAHYSGTRIGGLTFADAVSAVPASSYTAHLLAQNWAEAELAQKYGNSLYASAGEIATQNGSQQLPTHPKWSSPWKKIPKKIKTAQSAYCEVCKIECNSKDILYKHQQGKKHTKNIEKLNSTSSNPATSATTHANPALIGPSENPKKAAKKPAETPEELETKIRKVLEGGAPVNAVRTCGICNVVCNSDTVYRFHLLGQKHASMVKKP